MLGPGVRGARQSIAQVRDLGTQVSDLGDEQMTLFGKDSSSDQADAEHLHSANQLLWSSDC